MTKFLFSKKSVWRKRSVLVAVYSTSSLVVHVKDHCNSRGDLLWMHGQVSQVTAMKDTFWSDEYYKYSKMKSFVMCDSMESLESNQQLRFLASGTGWISESPTCILILSSFSSCCEKPMIRNSVLSSLNLRSLFNIQKTNVSDAVFHFPHHSKLFSSVVRSKWDVNLWIIRVTHSESWADDIYLTQKAHSCTMWTITDQERNLEARPILI